MKAARRRISGMGEFEKEWKRSSGRRTGVGEGSLAGEPAPNWTASFCESLGCCRPNSEKERFESHATLLLDGAVSCPCPCPDRDPATVETDLPMRAREDVVFFVAVRRQFLQTLEAARRIEGSIFGSLKRPVACAGKIAKMGRVGR